MGSAPSTKKVSKRDDVKISENTQELAASPAKAALEEHRERLREHPEIQELLPGLKNAVQMLENESNSKGTTAEEVIRDIGDIMEENVEQALYNYDSKEQRRIVCDQLAYDGMVPATSRFLEKILSANDGRITADDITANTMFTILNIMTSMTDRSVLVCEQCKDEGLLKVLLLQLENNDEKDNHTSDPISYRTALMYIGIIYNCAKGGVGRQFYNDHKAVGIIDPYTKSTDKTIKALAIMTIAYIVEEDEQNDLIVADNAIIQYVIRTFKEAMISSDKTSIQGFNVEELAQGLSSLANHDKNKKIIVDAGALPLLVQLMNEGDEKEIYCATEAVWTLAFNDENKEKITNEPNAIETLEKLRSHDNQQIQQAAHGALWVIHKGNGQLEKQLSGNEERSSHLGDGSSIVQNTDHVMISYQWDVQKLMIKVKKQLEQNGFNVWMDLDQMGGSTLQAMADAVENAAVVLVCLSQKYKDSPNCRVEAEYAFQQRKEVIPLMVEENYKATGWLGAILGTKFYINFAKKSQPFGLCVQQLIKQLGEKGKANQVKRRQSVVNGKMTETDGKSVDDTCSNWTNQEVVRWLKNNDINCKPLQQLIGEDLVFLAQMRAEAPEFFYFYMVRNLGMKTIPEMRTLRNALDKLGHQT
ncbi:uncharacterized protein [Ptychodera flava]|uniref:uncharacterized protein n=1 Tax=Ptychodera flava TaxID=63121 RepID=UPI00396A3408